MLDSSNPVPAVHRPPLTMAQFIMLQSLGREGSWAEGDAPLWRSPGIGLTTPITRLRRW